VGDPEWWTNTTSRYAMDVVRECAEAWERLITGKTQPGNIST
jgi:inorganic pyrophosphatase